MNANLDNYAAIGAAQDIRQRPAWWEILLAGAMLILAALISS
jgi:hypothetical protein